LVACAGLLALVVLPPRAAAQDTDPFSRLDPASRFAVESIIDSARVAMLPAAALRSKALEGIAVHADDHRIVSVVHDLFRYMRDARAVLGPVNDPDLEAAAEVLSAGVNPEQLKVFRNAPRGRPLASPFTVLVDLVTRGVPRNDATSAIVKLWRGGARDADFYGLWNSVKSDILEGLNPGAAMQNRVRDFPGRAPGNTVTPPTGQPESPSS
jgi:hypothetical protein